MSDEENVDDFLSQGGSGAKGAYLKNWKKRPTKTINLWLHTKVIPQRVHRHSFPRIVVREKDGVTTRSIWSGDYVCHEEKGVLEKQRERNDDDTRKTPPCSCAFCKMNEWIRAQVQETRRMLDEARKNEASPEKVAKIKSERVGLETLLFEVESDTEIQRYYAGGLVGLIDEKELSDQEKKDVRKAGINLREAWKQGALSRPSWLFQIVDDDDPSKGIQKTWEPELVGDKTKTVIHDKRASLGKEGGDPFKHPFCIQWESRPDEKEYGKKYHARPMDSVKFRPEISVLIRDADPLDTARDTKKFSPAELRAQLEVAAKYPLPFDLFFGGAQEPADPATDFPYGANEAPPKPAKAQAAPTAVDDDMVACDGGGDGGCGKEIRLSDPICPHCGFVYEVAPAAPPPPPLPPKAKSRSEALAEKAAAKPVAAPPAASPPVKPKPPEDDGGEVDPDDDLPFDSALADSSLRGGEKKCRGCEIVHPLSSFYKHPMMADGRLHYCKECIKSRVRERYQRANGRVEYERRRNQQPGRKEAQRGYVKSRRQASPEKYKARTQVGNALRDGRIEKEPCVVCRSTERVQGHHEDYSKGLEVRWLCFRCHLEEHGRVARS